jgi:hypothetical protein
MLKSRILCGAVCFFLGPLMSVWSAETALVEYDVDGTTKYVDLTWNTGSSTEQKQLKLPIHESFRVPVGSVAYCSAQKVTVYGEPSLNGSREVLGDGAQGTVHVVVHINWKLAGEATSDAPFGIAKVSTEVK